MNIRLILVSCLLLASICWAADPTKFTITNTRDAGPGSLRDALTRCARTGGHAIIAFNIPKSDPHFDADTGTWTLTYQDTPPPLTVSDVTIDGFTQAANQRDTNPHGPAIVLSGDHHSVEYAFVLINSSHVTITGFGIKEFLYGIEIFGPGSHDNRITGNYVGVNSDATAAAGNYNGIELVSGAHDNTIGGVTPAERNIVSGNQHVGIRISDAHRNTIIGNYVGVDRTGTNAVPNYDGICAEGRSRGNLIGGAKPGERNIASGNVAYGVDLFGWGVQDNIIRGNYIGTDVTGTKAIPNTYGLLFDDRSSRNIVGGLGDGEGNLISGNTAFGAYFYNNGTCSNVVCGNRIGTDLTGNKAIPNETGVHIDGGTFGNLVDKNLISGNLIAGVTIFALYTDHNTITRNLIGTDLTGNKPLGNGADGVRIAFGPKSNLVGGAPATANVIAHNGKSGVAIESPVDTRNRISCNAIYQNRNTGIELSRLGMTVPVITAVHVTATNCTITGNITSPNPATITIEIFGDDLKSTRHAQGKIYFGTTHPTSNGQWLFETASLKLAQVITATATDDQGNTSAFAQGVKF